MENKTDNMEMSFNNGHNKELVNQINLIGTDTEKRKRMMRMLHFLVNDDINGLHDAIGWDLSTIDRQSVEDLSYDILTNYCDDNDLEIIIKFCR